MAAPATSLDIRHSLLRRIAEARERTDALFAIVRPGSLYERPIPERHRLVFYLGHLEAFDWNLLGEWTLDLGPFKPGFDKLFAFGIDPVGGHLPADGANEWPQIPEIHAYVLGVRTELDRALASARVAPRAREYFDNGWLLNTALEHRLMHAETIAYLIHHLPYHRKYSLRERHLSSSGSAPARKVQIPAGEVTLGLERGSGFGWDNEFEAHRVHVEKFSVDAYPVTNGQFADFVAAGGYAERACWTADDFNWIRDRGMPHPLLWIRHENEWFYRGMFDEILLPLDWPVYVSHAEASAYARWKNAKLPTEAQWHRAAYGTPSGYENAFPWGWGTPDATRGNFDFHRWDAAPVTSHPAGRSAFGAGDLVGNGWEWTSTVFAPFRGFRPAPFYPGYSADFFDGRHYVMKGGSSRTAACMLRRSFRNWFQPHYPYIYAKFRCVED
ncbi:MAG: SUMF1/EgtB/PvdO family nonheme iron enzyme [Candidatus Acidiferrales bacterium]